MKIPCFWLEPTDKSQLYLRRFHVSSESCSKSGHGYHNAKIPFGIQPVRKNAEGYHLGYDDLKPAPNDSRWPTHCACGYAFTPEDAYQVFNDSIYRRTDTGEEIPRREAPAGALWRAWWLEPHTVGPDGICLMCLTPGGEWCIDDRASNCTMPDDNVHKCWVRHGDPTDPLGLKTGQPLHVDKNGLTCQAGAGSIQCGNYHGFLHAGHLTL